jgi:hypothetical protein
MQQKPVEHVVQEQALIPLYDVDRAKKIVDYINVFLQFRSNFDGPITASFYEAQARKWLLLVCPLVLTPSAQAAKSTVSIGVAFPPLFPDKWPYFVIHDVGSRRLAPDHPFVASTGVIRVQALPLLAGAAAVPALIDLMVGIQLALSEMPPFAAPPTPPAAAPPVPALNSSTAQPAVSTILNAAVASPTAAAAAVLGAATSQRARLLRDAAEALHRQQLAAQDEFLEFREHAAALEAQLGKSRAALTAAVASLTARQHRLAEVEAPVLDAVRHAERWRAAQVDHPNAARCEPSDLIVGTDAANRAAIQLQAEVHATDDAYDLLERSLRKGQLSCDEYVRLVSDHARHQFVAKFQLHRAVGGGGAAAASPAGAVPSPGTPQLHQAAQAVPVARVAAPAASAAATSPLATSGGQPPGGAALSLAKLQLQFAWLSPQIVEDVYISAGSNYEAALEHLKAITS